MYRTRLCRIINELLFRLSFSFRCNRTRPTPSNTDIKVNDNAMWSLYFETDVSCISGTIYIFVIVDQPGRVEADKFWHLTSGKQDVLLLTVEYFWLFRVFDREWYESAHRDQTGGCKYGRKYGTDSQNLCVQRIQEKWEKWLIPRWIQTIYKNSAFVIRYYAIIFDCSYHC